MGGGNSAAYQKGPAYGASNVLPIIDAHSQFDENVPVARVIEYAARAGVTQVLLSARGGVTTAQVLDLGSTHPACIVPSVRIKGRAFNENLPGSTHFSTSSSRSRHSEQ